MARTANEHLLDARQMARFCSDGLIVLEDLVPRELNEAVYQDELNVEPQGYEFWNSSEAIRSVFDLPQVRGVIESLVGRNYVYDHSYLHTVKPNNSKSQNWHVDSGIMNPNPHNFDIQAFYFAHDTPVEMGPTLVLPGSHLRRASYWSISRYKNIEGQRHLAAKAGTIAFMHQDIWHCAQPNKTDRTRYVFKIRLDAVEQQRNLFNTDGFDDPEVIEILKTQYPWYGSDGQKETYQRLAFWRFLVGNDFILKKR
ncbi:phytanoyl-CoA dioxygenase family protein [Paenibacillus nasutitermitis]|uniref:Phytanoyl-CoA dioxygenase n=1 Tax=Paenibacillus nasutitermitis TaxID=1652958 RepID=A0A916YPP1_9BACL|nr:phytanoyl-CoA dioxygenase family protein [Paenibacillus nasutitermitis]GGD53907.1 hypothetical protein GCM10010911_09280 [Paenibacillus nasutitermitis]